MASGKKNYFRHSFFAHRDEKIVKIIEQFGMAGYGYFWILIELCAEQVDGELPDYFTFHQRTLLSSLVVRKDKLHSYLAATSQLLLIHAEVEETTVKLYIPNLPKYLGRYKDKKPFDGSN